VHSLAHRSSTHQVLGGEGGSSKRGATGVRGSGIFWNLVAVGMYGGTSHLAPLKNRETQHLKTKSLCCVFLPSSACTLKLTTEGVAGNRKTSVEARREHQNAWVLVGRDRGRLLKPRTSQSPGAQSLELGAQTVLSIM
jgi:hypothetical protein